MGRIRKEIKMSWQNKLRNTLCNIYELNIGKYGTNLSYTLYFPTKDIAYDIIDFIMECNESKILSLNHIQVANPYELLKANPYFSKEWLKYY